jgi:hypothetical protein
VSSTYYDSKWQQPVLSVDANNNPGQKVVYDDFDRPIEWYKIDKANPATKTPVQKKEYHLMCDLEDGENLKVTNPNGGEKFIPGQEMSIRWNNRETGNITISYQNNDGTGNQTIGTVSNQEGPGFYQWIIPQAAVGNRKIKVENTTESYSDVSDATFIVSRPPNIPSTPINPGSGQTGIASTVTLTRTGGDPDGDLVGYDVYFGTDNPPPKFNTTTTATFPFTNLTGHTKFYWQIVSKDPVSAVSGPVWNFTTANRPPVINPASCNWQDKENKGGNRWEIKLYWTGTDPDGDNLRHRILVAQVTDPEYQHPVDDGVLLGQSGEKMWFTADIEASEPKTYIWKVEAEDPNGGTSVWVEGASFQLY